MKIKTGLKEVILSHYSIVPPEQGGILGMKNGIVCSYIHDITTSKSECAVYRPNNSLLNNCIEKWANEAIDFCGIVHSHPNGQDVLSSGDMEYINKLYDMNPHLKKAYFPLVLNGQSLIVYAVEKIGNSLMLSQESVEQVK